MTGKALVEAWPVYTSSKTGARRASDTDLRTFNEGIVAFVGVLMMILSLRRYLRRRARWAARQMARSYDRPDDPPPSTEVAPIPVRVEGPARAMVILGDDDDQFRLRARAGVVLILGDGRRCTLREGTTLKCTFPGFTLLTSGSKSSVGAPGGTEFFVVAELPESEVEAPDAGVAHPFRQAAAGPVVELVPVQDRYECRLDPAPVKRRRLARLLPKVAPRDPEKKPRWRPYLHPGIALAILATFARWGRPQELVFALIVLATMLLMGSEDAGWVLDENDL